MLCKDGGLNGKKKLITKDARCPQEITSRIAKEKDAFNKKAIFTNKYD